MRIREKGVPPPYHQVPDPSPATFNGSRRVGDRVEGGCLRKRPEGLHPDGDLPRLDPWMPSSSSSSSSSKNQLQAAGRALIPAAPGGGCTPRSNPQAPKDEAPTMKKAEPGQSADGKKSGRNKKSSSEEKSEGKSEEEEEMMEGDDKGRNKKSPVIISEDAAAAGGKKRRSPAVLLEGSRCSRVNGRGWRCCQPTLVGYSLCEHHLGKGRLRSMNNVRGQLGSSKPAAAAAATPHHNKISSDEDGDEEDDYDDDDYDYEKEMKKKAKKIGTVRARSISSLLDASSPSSMLPPSSTNPSFHPLK